MELKIIQTILLSAFKYFFTMPYAMLIGLDWEFAVLSVLFGGIGSFMFFYYVYKPAVLLFGKIRNIIYKNYLFGLKPRCNGQNEKPRTKLFSKRSRFLANFKSKFGMWGIIISTPLFLSVPVGALLARRYYHRRKNIVLYMVLSFIGWAALFSGFVLIFPNLFTL